MDNKFEYVLKSPIKYASRGEQVLGYKISGQAPTGRVRNQLVEIKQMFIKAITGLQKSSNDVAPEAVNQGAKKDEESNAMDSKQIMMALYVSDIDVAKFQNIVRDMFIHGQLLKVDNEVVLTSTLIDQLELDEFENIIGGYLQSFLLPSLQ